jgi:hypothetical protein
MIKNKKGAMNEDIIGVLIALIIIVVLAGVQTNLYGFVENAIDDEVCRGTVAAKSFFESSAKLKLISKLLFSVQLKCNKIEYEFEEDAKEKQFEEIADMMKRCWYKYGEGKKDFYSDWTLQKDNSQLCFTCAVMHPNEYKFDSSYAKDFMEFLETKTTSVKKNDGSLERIEKPYKDVFNPGVVGVSAKKEQEKRDETKKEQLSETTKKEDMYELKTNFDIDSKNLKFKKINTGEDMFVVYRYDRVPRDSKETMKDMREETVKGAGVGVIGGIVVASASCLIFPPACGLTLIGGSLAVGGTLGTVSGGSESYLNNKNYIQYVDLMDKEEYFRICGIEPPSTEEIKQLRLKE